MRAVLQRVNRASVTVDGEVVGQIERGIMALVGMGPNDDEATMDYMLDKMVNLRIFEDDQDKMNLSLTNIDGELLLVPNFTLYGDARKGRRPGYSTGAAPQQARESFGRLYQKAAQLPLKKVNYGQFQAYMQVELVNDGPVTLLLDSDRLF